MRFRGIFDINAVYRNHAHDGVRAELYALAREVEHCSERFCAVDAAANLVVVLGVVGVERNGYDVDCFCELRGDILAVYEVAEPVGIETSCFALSVREVGDFTISSTR